MANKSVIASKQEQVASIVKSVEESKITMVTGFNGLSVSDINNLRSSLKVESASMTVYKNTLIRRAMAELGIEYNAELLTGPNALIYGNVDSVGVSKALTKYAKDKEALVIKGGFLDGAAISVETINELAKLPSREELIAKAVGGIKAPLSGLVYVLSGRISSLIHVVNAIKTKKENE